jgi:hypothetical protein
MNFQRSWPAFLVLLTAFCVLAWACGHDDTLREYLNAQFWFPFAKKPVHFQKKGIPRASAPFAGFSLEAGPAPLDQLRSAYAAMAYPSNERRDREPFVAFLAAARATPNLSQKQKEEIDLLDAKIDLRVASGAEVTPLERAKTKLRAFIRSARTPEYRSEARGWLAYAHFLLGEQSAAGKIYFDELNRPNSNHSAISLLNSLSLTYGHNGGSRLIAQLEDYFDTAAHAAFAIQLLTNPVWERQAIRYGQYEPREHLEPTSPPYEKLKQLLEKHRDLLASAYGADTLGLLAMRVALRAGDPPAALRIVESIPPDASARREPDFLWMFASANFLSRDYAAAEQPLLDLFASRQASANQKAAAVYGLCGVYRKLNNPVEQLRFALHMRTARDRDNLSFDGVYPAYDGYIYWGASGLDAGMLLDIEAPLEALRSFLELYPKDPQRDSVRYALAVRLAREHQYEESAKVYASLAVPWRAQRMNHLASLYRAAYQSDASPNQAAQAKFKLAEFIIANPNKIYFNDRVWNMFQSDALVAGAEYRLNAAERNLLLEQERELRDSQEELWRGYLILREVIAESSDLPLRRRAAVQALNALVAISQRFGRGTDIAIALKDLKSWLRNPSKPFPPTASPENSKP